MTDKLQFTRQSFDVVGICICLFMQMQNLQISTCCLVISSLPSHAMTTAIAPNFAHWAWLVLMHGPSQDNSLLHYRLHYS